MAITLFWDEPSDSTVSKVYIETSATKTGTYTELTNIDAKALGVWVTSYTDNAGTSSTWYRIRFYNGTNYTDYSDPICGGYYVKYTTIEKVQDFTGLTFTNTSTADLPSNTAIYDWISWAEDYIDNILGYTYKGINVVDEYVNFESYSDTFYTSHFPLLSVESISVNSGTLFVPSWTELSSTEYAISTKDVGKIKLAVALDSLDHRVKISYWYGYQTVPKNVEELATKLVARNIVKFIMNNKASSAGTEIAVGPIRISNKVADGVSLISGISGDLEDLKKNIGSFRSWFA